MAKKRSRYNKSTDLQLEVMIFQIQKWIGGDEWNKPGGERNIIQEVMRRLGVEEKRARVVVNEAWTRIRLNTALENVAYTLEGRIFQMLQRIVQIKEDTSLPASKRHSLILQVEFEINKMLGYSNRRNVDITTNGKDLPNHTTTIVNNLGGLLSGLSVDELVRIATNEVDVLNGKENAGKQRRNFDAQPE